MSKKIYKILSLLLCLCLVFEQAGFAQSIGQLDISGYLTSFRNNFAQDKFRPLHLRYLSYDTLNNNFRLLLDKGDLKDIKASQVAETTQKLLEYFFVGVTLPNSSFWVNLRPDSPDNIIDPYLAQTDVGKILLEADLQLKKDTAKLTSPENPKGKEYWDKLYKKAGELFGYDNITIPTLTRPWIVPDEIIVREANDNAYIYKATLKVKLEQDHLKDSAVYSFDDSRLKELNEYSSQLIRELIIPELTKEINTSKRYASLKQVYYSLILAQWFKEKFASKGGFYSSLIDRQNLNGITSKEDWSKTTYFKEYQKSFQKGEYNIQQPIYTPFGQTIRSYFSGGIVLNLTRANNVLRVQPTRYRDLTQIFSRDPKAALLSAKKGNGSPYALDVSSISSSPIVSNGGGSSIKIDDFPERYFRPPDRDEKTRKLREVAVQHDRRNTNIDPRCLHLENIQLISRHESREERIILALLRACRHMQIFGDISLNPNLLSEVESIIDEEIISVLDKRTRFQYSLTGDLSEGFSEQNIFLMLIDLLRYAPKEIKTNSLNFITPRLVEYLDGYCDSGWLRGRHEGIHSDWPLRIYALIVRCLPDRSLRNEITEERIRRVGDIVRDRNFIVYNVTHEEFEPIKAAYEVLKEMAKANPEAVSRIVNTIFLVGIVFWGSRGGVFTDPDINENGEYVRIPVAAFNPLGIPEAFYYIASTNPYAITWDFVEGLFKGMRSGNGFLRVVCSDILLEVAKIKKDFHRSLAGILPSFFRSPSETVAVNSLEAYHIVIGENPELLKSGVVSEIQTISQRSDFTGKTASKLYVNLVKKFQTAVEARKMLSAPKDIEGTRLPIQTDITTMLTQRKPAALQGISAILFEKAKGPHYLDAYEEYLEIAREDPSVITDEWIDLILKNLYWNSYPGAFEILVELAKIKPDILTTTPIVEKVVERFTKVVEYHGESEAEGKYILYSDSLVISGHADAIETYGQLVLINPRILKPEHVQAIIDAPWVFTAALGHTDPAAEYFDYRNLILPIFRMWYANGIDITEFTLDISNIRRASDRRPEGLKDEPLLSAGNLKMLTSGGTPLSKQPQDVSITDQIMADIEAAVKEMRFQGEGKTHFLFEAHLFPMLIRDRLERGIEEAEIIVVETAPAFIGIFNGVSFGKVTVEEGINEWAKLYKDLGQSSIPKSDEIWIRQYFELLYDKHKLVVCVPREFDTEIAKLQIAGQESLEQSIENFILNGDPRYLAEGVESYCRKYAEAYMRKDDSLKDLLRKLYDIAPMANILVVRGYVHTEPSITLIRETREKGDKRKISREFFTMPYAFTYLEQIIRRFIFNKPFRSKDDEYITCLKAGLFCILISGLSPEEFTLQKQESITTLIERLDIQKELPRIANFISTRQQQNDWQTQLYAALESIEPSSAATQEKPEIGNDKDDKGSGGNAHSSGATAQGSSNEKPEQADKDKGSSPLGGIDFRGLPSVTQPTGNIPGANQNSPIIMNNRVDINLNEEWSQIQNILNAGIIPSSQRIKEYLIVCCENGDFNQEIDNVLNCIANILRLQEDNSCPAESSFREILSLLESDKSTEEFTIALVNIVPQPQEPKVQSLP